VADEYKRIREDLSAQSRDLVARLVPELSADRLQHVTEELEKHNLDILSDLLKSSKCGPPRDMLVSRGSPGSRTPHNDSSPGDDYVNVAADESGRGIPLILRDSSYFSTNNTTRSHGISRTITTIVPSRADFEPGGHAALTHRHPQLAISESQIPADENLQPQGRQGSGTEHGYVHPSDVFPTQVSRYGIAGMQSLLTL
jgi:hypothetical protein